MAKPYKQKPTPMPDTTRLPPKPDGTSPTGDTTVVPPKPGGNTGTGDTTVMPGKKPKKAQKKDNGVSFALGERARVKL